MASWEIVSLQFLGKIPPKDVLDLFDRRFSQKEEPPPRVAGDRASYQLASAAHGTLYDYDFPGFNGVPELKSVKWRSPFDLGKFQGVLHAMGYPNVLGSKYDHGDDIVPQSPVLDTPSRDNMLTAEERYLVDYLFPELEIPKPKVEAVELPPLEANGLDLV